MATFKTAVRTSVKDASTSELLAEVHRALYPLKTPNMFATVGVLQWTGGNFNLTLDRQRVILRRAGDGETTAELAQSLRLTRGTVRNYLSEAISKLHAANRFEAARIARNKGWL
jgi:two-component system, NarL family, response regulator DesR